MKRLPVLLFLLTFAFGATHAQNWGWNTKTVRGDGKLITQEREVDGFEGVKACCSLTVEVTPGSTISVRVEAEENLQEYVETKVFGNTLEIGFKDKVNVQPKRDITVYVTMPKLEMLDASSSADIYTTGEFKGDRLKLESSSGSTVKAMFSGRDVTADVSSGGNIKVAGTADYIEAEASSGGQVHAEDLEAKEADADVSSGGGIEVNVSEKLKADASSGGRVRYSGKPSTVNTDASSGGSVRKG